MTKIWRITKWDSDRMAGNWDMPGELSETEVERVLERLVCRDLSEFEILASSRRKNDPDFSPFLQRNPGSKPISYGENPHYTAEYVDKGT